MNWDYLAGFTDGEGCIKMYNGPRITYGQKSVEILEEIRHFLGLDHLKITYSRNCNYLQICDAKAICRILTELVPRLIVKKEDAECLLNHPWVSKHLVASERMV